MIYITSHKLYVLRVKSIFNTEVEEKRGDWLYTTLMCTLMLVQNKHLDCDAVYFFNYLYNAYKYIFTNVQYIKILSACISHVSYFIINSYVHIVNGNWLCKLLCCNYNLPMIQLEHLNLAFWVCNLHSTETPFEIMLVLGVCISCNREKISIVH